MSLQEHQIPGLSNDEDRDFLSELLSWTQNIEKKLQRHEADIEELKQLFLASQAQSPSNSPNAQQPASDKEPKVEAKPEQASEASTTESSKSVPPPSPSTEPLAFDNRTEANAHLKPPQKAVASSPKSPIIASL